MSTSEPIQPNLPKTAVVLCLVLEPEIDHLAQGMSHIVHIEKMAQGLHNEPPKLRQEVQAAIDRIEATTGAERIVLGYGLCSRGTEGVRTRRCTLVMPRAHDCITLLLGSKERYRDYVAKCPGTYWYSPGWIKHSTMPGQERFEKLYAEYVEKYGEDNARYLMDTEQHWYRTYQRATYVDLGLWPSEKEVDHACSCARWLGWEFDRQVGDPDLLKRLLAGPWDAESFLVLEPGRSFRLRADDSVIEAE